MKHRASITYRKLTSPLVVATSFANHAFNLTSDHSIDRLNGGLSVSTIGLLSPRNDWACLSTSRCTISGLYSRMKYWYAAAEVQLVRRLSMSAPYGARGQYWRRRHLLMHTRSCSLNSNADEQHQRDGNEHDSGAPIPLAEILLAPTVQHHGSSLAVQ